MWKLLPAIGAFALAVAANGPTAACSVTLWEYDYAGSVERQREALRNADSIVLARLKRSDQWYDDTWYRDVLLYDSLMTLSGRPPPGVIISASEGDYLDCYYPGSIRRGDLALVYLKQEPAGLFGRRTKIILAIPLEHNRLADTGDMIRTATARRPSANP